MPTLDCSLCVCVDWINKISAYYLQWRNHILILHVTSTILHQAQHIGISLTHAIFTSNKGNSASFDTTFSNMFTLFLFFYELCCLLSVVSIIQLYNYTFVFCNCVGVCVDDGLLQQPYLTQSDWGCTQMWNLLFIIIIILLFELVFGIGLYSLVFTIICIVPDGSFVGQLLYRPTASFKYTFVSALLLHYIDSLFLKKKVIIWKRVK